MTAVIIFLLLLYYSVNNQNRHNFSLTNEEVPTQSLETEEGLKKAGVYVPVTGKVLMRQKLEW